MSGPVTWRRCSASTACVEVAARWLRGGRCDSSACVEVAGGPGVVLMRDSADPDGPRLSFDAARWREFVAGVRGGEFEEDPC